MFVNTQRLSRLNPETLVYCAHEYTQSNGRFALVAEPGNEAIRHRMAEVDVARSKGEATIPTSIALELATNPFMREYGRASGRERVCQDVYISVVGVSLKKKTSY